MTIHAIGLTTLNNTAKDFRNDMSGLLFGATAARPTGARSGVRYGTPTNTVSLVAFAGTIKPHSGVMDVQTAAAAGPYFYAVTANETFTVSAAHATLPRVDIVTIRINDDVEDSSGLESATTHYKAGTAAASPVAPSPDTTRDMIIATIAVPASGGGNPVASWVAPYAVAGGGVVPIRTATELAALWLAYPPTTDAPVITTRKDAAASKIIEYSVDGANKYVVDARLSTDPDPLAVRAAYNFRPANAAALSALAGTYTLRADDKAFQVDTGAVYRSDGANWKAWESDWLTWATVPTGITVGNGTLTQKYKFAGGICFVQGHFTLGSTSAVASSPVLTHPVTAASPSALDNFPLGDAAFLDTGTASYNAAVMGVNSTTCWLRTSVASGTYTTPGGLSNTVPFTWTNTDVMMWRYQFAVA